MAKNITTQIFCFDDHRGFTEDIRKRFTDTSRYIVESFQTREELLERIEKEKVHNFCKVAILGVHDSNDQIGMINQLSADIKNKDSRIGLILLGSPDKMDEIKKIVKFNIVAYIPKNANSVLRIHNTVKKLISVHSIGIFKTKKNLSVYILLGFLLLSVLIILIAYFILPQYY
jgi:hypothetical protein